MEKTRKNNGEGSARKLENGQWECTIQSQFLNPKTFKPKRFKRKGKNETEARKNAKQALLIWEKEFISNGIDTKVNKSKTLGAYMDEFVENIAKNTLSGSGYHTYIRALGNYFYKYDIANLQLHMLNKKVFEDYYDEINSKFSKKTCAFPIQICKRLCDELVDRSLLDENYARQAKIKQEVIDEYNKEREENEKTRKVIYSVEDIKKMYTAYKQHNGQYARVAMFLLESGLRSSEFASITNDCIDFEKRTIRINKTRSTRFKNNDKEEGIEEYVKVPKNKKTREIYMSDLCLECVKEMQEQTLLYCKNNYDNLLYPSFRNGKRRSNSTMEVGFKALCDKLGIDRDVRRTKRGMEKGLCLHSLRHTFSSYANTSKDGNSFVTSLMLGHTQRVDEEVYTHVNADILKTINTPSKLFLEEKKEEKGDDYNEDEVKILRVLLDKYKDVL